MTEDSDGPHEPLTEARFDAALAARGIAPSPEDRAAAFTIATYLDACARLLRAPHQEAEVGSDDSDE